MHTTRLALGELYAYFAHPLQWHWLGSASDYSHQVLAATDPPRAWTGTLRGEHVPEVMVVDINEIQHLSPWLDQRAPNLDDLPRLVVVCNTRKPPAWKNQPRFAAFYSRCETTDVIQSLTYYLADKLSEATTVHAVLMRINTSGVLLMGESGSGKSQLALELIQQGHALVADDAPLLYRSGLKRLTGTCHPVLANFLEVRSLGLLNIRAMYGTQAIAACQEIDMLIELHPTHTSVERRLSPQLTSRKLCGVDVACLHLEVISNQSIACLIEASVRQQQLLQQGYDASLDFSEQQLRWMEFKQK
ncbi:MAG: hypothetical protein HY080_13510 [Gammaproteobacteria bacterium]|nr:hypothetical protein [Gammaproteobacteria bacterium]